MYVISKRDPDNINMNILYSKNIETVTQVNGNDNTDKLYNNTNGDGDDDDDK